jgi:hypothetical protein
MRRHRDWERTPWGDEYCDELYQCKECDAWSIVTFLDRFSGEDKMSVRGPLSDEEVTAIAGRSQILKK